MTRHLATLLLLISCLVMAGCHEPPPRHTARHAKLTKVSGKRVSWVDGRGEQVGKWRVGHRRLKVYDELRRPVGVVVWSGDALTSRKVELRELGQPVQALTRTVTKRDESRWQLSARRALVFERERVVLFDAEEHMLGEVVRDEGALVWRGFDGATGGELVARLDEAALVVMRGEELVLRAASRPELSVAHALAQALPDSTALERALIAVLLDAWRSVSKV